MDGEPMISVESKVKSFTDDGQGQGMDLTVRSDDSRSDTVVLEVGPVTIRVRYSDLRAALDNAVNTR